MQRDFERARHIEDLNVGSRTAELRPLRDEGIDAAVDDIGMPAGTDDRDLGGGVGKNGHGLKPFRVWRFQ
ncbi:hypothetical protein FQZ97_1236380 [compost metagenome]